jgi:uncharacterized protein YcbK (DUF882 family)
MDRWRHFKASEVEGLEPELVAKVDLACERAGVAFIITSGKRTESGNLEAGGVAGSSHLKGLAVDLSCKDSPDRYRMVKALLDVGFMRLGIYDRHIHTDMDPDLPSEVIWIGVSH